MGAHGKLTAEMGRRLEAWVPKGFEVRYDHGDRAKGNVGSIACWVGEGSAKKSRANRLTELDIAILKPTGERPLACALIEIEESSGRPKGLLGDLFGTLMADHVAFQEEEFSIDERTSLMMFVKGRAEHFERMKSIVANANASRAGLLGQNRRIGRVTGAIYGDETELEEMLKKHVSEAIGRF